MPIDIKALLDELAKKESDNSKKVSFLDDANLDDVNQVQEYVLEKDEMIAKRRFISAVNESKKKYSKFFICIQSDRQKDPNFLTI